MKGADRGCSNLGEEITLNEIEGMSLKHFIPKKKKKHHFRRVPGI